MDDGNTSEGVKVMPARGGWLAVSTPGSPFIIGVIGASEAEALERFREALASARRLREARLGTSGA